MTKIIKNTAIRNQKLTNINAAVLSFVLKNYKTININSLIFDRKYIIKNFNIFIFKRRLYISKILFLIAGIEFLISGVYYIASFPFVRETIVLATTVQPERFTELYFQDHTKLPSIVVPKKQYSFSFTIHNLEYQDMDYPYEVYIEDSDGNRQTIDENSITLKENAFTTIQQGFVLNQPIERSKVVINIKKNQQITFWIEGKKVN